jgi:hypothetical protein
MSALALLVPFVIAIIATLIHAAISGAWAARSLAAMFFFALMLLMLPGLIRP